MTNNLSSEAFLDALLKLPEMWYVKTSSDGKYVAWGWLGVRETMDVYAAPTDGSRPAFALTHSDQHVVPVSWTPDNKAVIVAQDFEGNERATLYRVDLDSPGVMQPLTEADPDYFIRGGSLHPNGKWLIYGANYDFDAGTEIEPTWLYRHDLETGERLPLAKPDQSCWYSPKLNTQGSYIHYWRRSDHPSGRQVWLVDIDGRADREILNFGADKKVFASWLPDGERIIFVAETDTHYRVGLWHLADGSIRWLIDDPQRNIEEAYVPYGSDKAVIIDVHGARNKPSLLDLETGEETPLPDMPGSLRPLAPVDSSEWVGLHYSATQAMDVIRFDVSNPASYTSLSNVWQHTSLTSADLAPAEDYRWRADDGLEIQGWLYRARSEAKGTVVYVHGGPTAHSEDAINNQIQFFVRQGFNVLDPNYRGSTGFNRAYKEAIKVDGWGGREQDDIRAGIEALIREGIAQPGKVGITGTSYGGYSSWCAITRYPTQIVAASAPVCGMTDLVVDYETTRPDLRPYSEEMLSGSPNEVPERYRERSPIHYVSNIKGRLLIVQGLRDPNVTPANVRVVQTALNDAGIEHQILTFDDEGHGIDRTYNQKTLNLRLVEFFIEAFADAGT